MILRLFSPKMAKGICVFSKRETHQIPEVHQPSMCLFNRFLQLSYCTHISKTTQTFVLPGSSAVVFPHKSL